MATTARATGSAAALALGLVLTSGCTAKPSVAARSAAASASTSSSQASSSQGASSQGAASSTASASPSAATPLPSHAKLAGRLAFLRLADADGTSSSLFTSDTDGSHERALTKPQPHTLDVSTRWSPDGNQVLFTRDTAQNTSDEAIRIMTVSADGTNLRYLTPARLQNGDVSYDSDGDYSSDGQHIAYVHYTGTTTDDLQYSNIYVMDVNGAHAHAVTHFPIHSGEVNGVRWSPDGKRLGFTYMNKAAAPVGKSALFTVGLDGSGLKRLTSWDVGAMGVPDWSAATGLLAFRATPDEESGVGNFYTVDADGRGLRQVTKFTDTVISHQVGFSPDGQWIVFTARPNQDSAHGARYIAKVDGSDTFQVSAPELSESSVDWKK